MNSGNISPYTMRSKRHPSSVLPEFCRAIVPDFTPLGGSRPDAAVVACTAVWMEEETEAQENTFLPPDVLDTAMAMLCAPLNVTHARDLRGRATHFRLPAATVRLRTIDWNAMQALKGAIAFMPGGGLSVTMSVPESVTKLPERFMEKWAPVGRVDLGRTSLQRIDYWCLYGCSYLTAVILPPSLTEVGDGFLWGCDRLQSVDMRHTALHTVGGYFAYDCRRLTNVVLPDTVTEVGTDFLCKCGPVTVASGSTVVQAAAAKHIPILDHGNDDNEEESDDNEEESDDNDEDDEDDDGNDDNDDDDW